MKHGNRLAAAGVCTLLTLPLAIVPANASSSSSPSKVVREVVDATLDPQGGVLKTQVQQLVQLRSSGGKEVSVQVPELPGLSYRSLTGFLGPKKTSGGLVWRTAGNKDILSHATVNNAKLPLAASVRYTLNGRTVTTSDLKGRSGLVGVTIKLTNTSRHSKDLSYNGVATESGESSTDYYVPIVYQVVAEFPRKSWWDVAGTDAFVQTDDKGNQVIVRPGLLNPPVGPQSDTVTLQARSDKVLLPEIRVLASPRVSTSDVDNLKNQVDTIRGLYGSVGTLYDLLGKVYSGTLLVSGGLGTIIPLLGTKDQATNQPVITIDPNTGLPNTLIGGLGFIRNAIRDQVIPPLGQRDPATGKGIVSLDSSGAPNTLISFLQFVSNAVGNRDPKVTDPNNPTGRVVSSGSTLLAGLQQLKDALENQLIPALQCPAPPPSYAVPVIDPAVIAFPNKPVGCPGLTAKGYLDSTIRPSLPVPVQPLLDAFEKQAIYNPDFNSPQPQIAGRCHSTIARDCTPLEYFEQCGACFSTTDPKFDRAIPTSIDADRTPNQAACKPTLQNYASTPPAGCRYKVGPAFLPALINGFQVIDAGLTAGLPQLNSLDMNKPGLVEGLAIVIGKLQTFSKDPKTAGLVDGMQLIVGGLNTIMDKLQTFKGDAQHTDLLGLVDAMQLLKGGEDQISQGLFAINELGVRTAKNTVGEQGDTAALNAATLEDQAKSIQNTALLAKGTDAAYTTYLYTIKGQTTDTRDNAVRGGLLGISAIAIALIGRRRLLPI